MTFNRLLAWRVGLAAGLVLFLVLMPSYVRLMFWYGLAAHLFGGTLPTGRPGRGYPGQRLGLLGAIVDPYVLIRLG